MNDIYEKIDNLISKADEYNSAIDKNLQAINSLLIPYIRQEYEGYVIPDTDSKQFYIKHIDEIFFDWDNHEYYVSMTGIYIHVGYGEYPTMYTAIHASSVNMKINIGTLLTDGCFLTKYGKVPKVHSDKMKEIIDIYLPSVTSANGKAIRRNSNVAYIENGKICLGRVTGFNENTMLFTIKNHDDSYAYKKGSELTKC